MKGESRAQQPGSRSDFNRKDKTATCQHCGGPRLRTESKAFCSPGCSHAWRSGRSYVPSETVPPTVAEMIAEMHAALDRLQALVEETP